MPEVRWIKITTDMFDDEKIRLLEAMPDADTLLVIWVKLICQAGKVNADGYIFLAREMPYSEEQLATVFNRPVNTVKLALRAFQQFGMIEYDENGAIFLPNFEKHQNTQGLEKIREQTRLRVAKHRALKAGNDDVTDGNVTVTQQSRVDKNRVEEEQEKKREEEDVVAEIFKTFEENYQKMSTQTTARLNDLIDEYGAEETLAALNEGIKYNKKSFAYVEKILKNQSDMPKLTPTSTGIPRKNHGEIFRR